MNLGHLCVLSVSSHADGPQRPSQAGVRLRVPPPSLVFTILVGTPLPILSFSTNNVWLTIADVNAVRGRMIRWGWCGNCQGLPSAEAASVMAVAAVASVVAVAAVPRPSGSDSLSLLSGIVT